MCISLVWLIESAGGFKHDLAVIGCFQHVGREAGMFLIVSATSALQKRSLRIRNCTSLFALPQSTAPEKMAEAAALVSFDLDQAIPGSFQQRIVFEGCRFLAVVDGG